MVSPPKKSNPASIQVLLIDDEADTLLPTLAQDLEPMGFTLHKETRQARALASVASMAPDVILLDLHFPGDDLRKDGRTTGGELLTAIRRQFESIPVIVFTTRLDDVDIPREVFDEPPHGYFAKPDFQLNTDWPAALAQWMRNAIETVAFTRDYASVDLGFVLGDTKEMREVAGLVQTAARNTLNVLLYGETGTGKRGVAEAIHRLSGRRGRFEQLNCAGIDAHALEDILFGRLRGTATVAAEFHPGLFELAVQGTLFLDEIHRMPMILQDKLMHVIEQGKLHRPGDSHDIPVDIRLIAGSDHSLSDLVAEGLLRENLAYRLAGGLLISLPSLRQRLDDLPALFADFVARANQANGRSISAVLRPEALAKLHAHTWPGDIGEMELVIARAVVTTTSTVLQPEDIEFVQMGPQASRPAIAPNVPADNHELVIKALTDQLEALAPGPRYQFLKDQGLPLRTEILTEFICRLRRKSGRKINHKALARELDPHTSLDTIRQTVCGCVSLSTMECNQ